MRLRYRDGWLEIDQNEKGSNFIYLVKCDKKEAEEIIYQANCRMATELHEVIECVLDAEIERDY